jgi:WD40 repeat protein
MNSALSFRGSNSGGGADPPSKKGDDDPAKGWDAPPPDEGTAWPADNDTTLLLVHKRQVRQKIGLGEEITRIAFSPSDSLIAATKKLDYSDWDSLSLYNNTKDSKALVEYRDVKASGGFAFAPLPDNAIATPYNKWLRATPELSDRLEPSALRPAIAIHDLEKRKKRLKRDFTVIRGPIAYSPNGRLIAGIDRQDSSRINILGTNSNLRNLHTILHHTDEVTQLAFHPNGGSLVSISKDGWARMTCLDSGRTLRRYEATGQRNPKLLQISPDGELVVSIWDRTVNVWYPTTGVVNVYNLHTVRQMEGWPLCISPNCRYLACRTDGGFDVSDLLTGKFRGDVSGLTTDVTCASFSSDSRSLVIGKIDGEISLYDVITVD